MPCEILMAIVEELSEQSMHILSQVCHQLQNIVTSSYSSLVEFRPPNNLSEWLEVTDEQCGALLLWRRSGSFIPPKTLWFTGLSQTTDYHLKALDIFVQSLKIHGPLDRIYLSLYIGPVQDSLALLSFLQSVGTNGCKHFVCHGISRRGVQSSINGHSVLSPTSFEVLHLHSPLFFGSHSVSFSLSALRLSPIRELSLTNTSLAPSDWSTLLQTLALPHLSTLMLDDSCHTRDLVDFLKRHKVQELQVSNLGTAVGVDIGHLRQFCLQTTLPTLSSLDASPDVIIWLMHLIDISYPFQKLVVRLNYLRNKRHLCSTILDCTRHLRDLHELQVIVPDNIEDLSAYSESESTHTCSARKVVLKVWPPQGDNPEVLVGQLHLPHQITLEHHILDILRPLAGCVSASRKYRATH